MLRKLNGNADRTTSWLSSEQLDMLDICSISFTSVCIALGAGWRGEFGSHQWTGCSWNLLLNHCLLTLGPDLLSQMVTASLFSPSSLPKQHRRETAWMWNELPSCVYKSAAVQSCLSQDLHYCIQCEQGNNLSGKMLLYMKASACS